MTSLVEKFLYEYKQLVGFTMSYFNVSEAELLQPYMRDTKYPGSAKFKKYFPLVKACKKARNVISHEDYIYNNKPMFYISEELLLELEDLNSKFNREPTCAETMIKLADLSTRSSSDKVLDTVKDMYKRHYTYIPIINEKNQIIGIFSEYTAFRALLVEDILYFSDKETTFENISSLTSLEIAFAEDAVFLAKGTDKVRNIIKQISKNKVSDKFGCILITSDGTKNGTLLGLLTPWDLVEEM